ncbi:efflux RND transporter periplasmic adaptor subunit [Sorangium cellulosum]|uniref:efflux RND transporter periplasmic adaptor subunit n=1 Tax=Sorangium cellulosum TaxID=56 RepID=UPI001EED2850|nr:efflux RND transporter periplasmic adaptor subunit [Sorangium cellulosum]
MATSGCQRKEHEAQASTPRRLKLDTVGAVTRPIPDTLLVTGTLEATTVNDIAANATGRVVAIHGERGDQVKKHAALAKLDVRLAALQAAAANAQAKVASDQAELQAQECARTEKLAASGAVPMAEWERQSWQCKIAKSTMAASQVQATMAAQYVSDGTIRAPMDGHLVERFVEVGQFVTPTTKVATLVSLDELRLRISVPEIQLGGLKKDAAVTFRVAAYGARIFSGTLARVSPVVRPETRDVLAEATVPNGDHALRPGMFATVELQLGTKLASVVPSSAVVVREGTSRVFVVRDGRIEERAVQLGPRVGNEVAVLKGVARDEPIVREPGEEVKNGLFAE